MHARTAFGLAITLAFAAGSYAQTANLVELAKAEKARRAKVKATGAEVKAYSDGGKAPEASAADEAAPAEATGASTMSGPASGPAPATAKKDKEKTPEEQAAERAKEWAEKLKQTQDEIKSLEDSITTNERTLASMYNITPARADLASRIEADKKKLAGLKQKLVEYEDERRKAGIPRPR